MNRVMVAVMLACSVDTATVTAAEVRFVDQAKVVTVEEVTKTIKVRKPSESCWQERVVDAGAIARLCAETRTFTINESAA